MSEDSIKTIQAWMKRSYGATFDGIRPSVGVIRRMNWLISELEQYKAEIGVLEKLIADWRATCVTEQTVGMEWKDRAEKAEAEVKRLKSILANKGMHF